MTLEQLPAGQRAWISEVQGDDGLRARMFALGVRAGREVAVIRRAAWGGPLHVRIGTTDLVMRRREANLIRLAIVEATA